jgi:2-keto-4-pentenoate hydratase/2-oxohepta-3-ene-1,7-dioic acid hydratase in catechol pathway
MLLAPLAPEHVRTVRCLGLNYAAHAKEVRPLSLGLTRRSMWYVSKPKY